MTDPKPKIAGRFEFDPATQSLEVWFSTGVHYVLGPAETFDKALRGEVPVKLTGGQATAKLNLTWSEQLKSKVEEESKRALDLARPSKKSYDTKGRLKLSLADLNLESLLADLKEGVLRDEAGRANPDGNGDTPEAGKGK